jgi:hypothetical protein
MGFLMFEWSGTIYLLCFAASVASAIFLAHAYARDGMRIWVWSAVGFAMLAIGNFFAAADALFELKDGFFFYEVIATFFAVTVVISGLVWEEA